MSDFIKLRNIVKVYGSGANSFLALKGIDLDINKGEFVALMGPSGSGKSTMANILGCLDKATKGSYFFNGVDVFSLSGGQQQRVAIARAIASNPLFLLADEPTGNLDTKRSVEIMDILSNLNKELGITILMVTHEPEMAQYASREVHFRDGEVNAAEAVLR